MRALLASVRAQCALQFNFDAEGVALKRRMAEHIVPLPDVQRRLVLELCGLEKPYPSEPGSHPAGRSPHARCRCAPAGRPVCQHHRVAARSRLPALDLEGAGRSVRRPGLSRPCRFTVEKVRLARAPAALDGVKAVLLRPDGYVAWAGNDTAESAGAQRELAKWLIWG